MSRTDLSRSRGDGGGLEEEEGEALHGEVDEGAAGMCEEAPKVGSHHALPPDAVPLVELLRGENVDCHTAPPSQDQIFGNDEQMGKREKERDGRKEDVPS